MHNELQNNNTSSIDATSVSQNSYIQLSGNKTTMKVFPGLVKKKLYFKYFKRPDSVC